MICPICGAQTKVIDTRDGGCVILRKRMCLRNNNHRFVTKEKPHDLKDESFAHYLRRLLEEMEEAG